MAESAPAKANATVVAPSASGPSFEIVVRGLYRRDAEGIRVAGETAGAALTRALKLDVSANLEPIMHWSGLEHIVALDFDRPEHASRITEDEIDTLFPATLPRPLAAWRSHGGGLRAIFVAVANERAVELAGVWALLAPLRHLLAWRLEAKTDSRHPAGRRGDETCGPIHWLTPNAEFVVPGDSARSVATEVEVSEWLEEHGLSRGRHAGDKCPWCGSRGASGNPPVLIDDHGVKCFRCSSSASWDRLAGRLVRDHQPSLRDAARELVHFAHQRYALKDLRPGLPEQMLQPAWRAILRAANADRLAIDDDAERKKWEGRVDRASWPLIDVVRTVSGAWADATTLVPRKITAERTLREMPWSLSGTRIDMALNAGPLPGFVAIEPINCAEVVGPYVQPTPGAIVVRRPRGPRDLPPVELGDRPPSPERVEDAWRAVAKRLSGLHRGYLSCLTAVDLLAQRALGLPPVIVVTGASGTAKTASVRLAGAMVGRRAAEITLPEPDVTRRQIGLAIEEGCGALYIDEIGRVREVYQKLEPVLALNSTLRFAAKYSNERVVQVRSPIVVIGSTQPRAIVRSPELGRRGVGYRLVELAERWEQWGDLAAARSVDELRPHLDVITASIWWRLWQGGQAVNWRELCFAEFDAVPLLDLDLDDADGPGPEPAVRALYERFRTASDAELTHGARWAAWLDASPGTPGGGLLGELVDFEADHRGTQAAVAELERLELGPVLGFQHPKLRLLVRRRGGHWLVKFVEVGAPKGKSHLRSDLPPSFAMEGVIQTLENGTARAGARSDTTDGSARIHQRDFDAHDTHDTHDTHSLSVVEEDQRRDRGDGTTGSRSSGEGSGPARPCVSVLSNDLGDLSHALPCVSPCATPSSDAPVFVDFETRSLASLSAIGGRLYATHPSTEPICAVAMLPSGTVVEWTGGPPPPTLIDALTTGASVAAHNANGFDRYIWRALGWPEPTLWLDTMQLARLAGLPAKLEVLGEVVGCPKDMEGRKVTIALSRPDRKTGALKPIDPDTRARILSYCRGDVEVLLHAWTTHLSRVAAAETGVRAVDTVINDRGFRFDAELARAVIDVEEAYIRKLGDAAPVSAAVLASPVQLGAWLREHGVEVPDARRETLEPLLADLNLAVDVRAAIRARLGSSGIAAKKLRTALATLSPDSRIRDSLVYYGAHTGRWSGRGLQPQNLPRGAPVDVDEAIRAAQARDLDAVQCIARDASVSVEDVLATLVRPCICAPADRILAVVDYSSIEARVLLWAAGDNPGLELYRRHEDPYRVMAARLFGTEAERVTKSQRQLGKALTLGCGFGMGAEKFRAHAESYGINWIDLEITPPRAVETWRDEHAAVAGQRTGRTRDGRVLRRGGLWRQLEDAAIRALGTGSPTSAGRCTWARNKSDLVCVLPSGRRMVYRAARIEERNGRAALRVQQHGELVWSWGGKFTENIVQAIARDLLADALVRLERAGHEVVLHIHDEIVCEVDRETELAAIAELVKTAPAWADGLPIAVEGYVARRYRK